MQLQRFMTVISPGYQILIHGVISLTDARHEIKHLKHKRTLNTTLKHTVLKYTWIYFINILTLYLKETSLTLLQTEQIKVMRKLSELCLLMEVWGIWSYTNGTDK